MKAHVPIAVACVLPCLPAQSGGETTVQVVGKVSDWQGTPIAGAAVGLATPDGVVTSEVLEDPATLTDEEGRFRIAYPVPDEGAPSGRRAVHVAKVGWASVLQRVRLQKEGDELRAETDIGDVVLAEGARLFGRVRDAQGDAVVGARVTATDALTAARGLPGMNDALCVATTDGSGIFSLPCALPQATRIRISAEGHHHRVVSPVSRLTPLEVTLEPSGIVFGRVLDPRGSGVQTTVHVRHEHRYGSETLLAGADGSFRFTIGQPGRFRLQAIAPPNSGWKTTHSPILGGPRANLELVLAPAEEDRTGAMLAVRCVDKETGGEIREFRAVSLWDEYANRNANYRDYRLAHDLERKAVVAKDGTARLPGPNDSQPEVGSVHVLAPGRAPATLAEVEWKMPEEGADEELDLTVELVPEAVVLGRVVDEGTGEPIAGARVWVRAKQDPRLGVYDPGSRSPENAAVSGEDGAFRLGQLGEGAWEILVQHPGRPEIPPVELELARAEHGELTIEMPRGAVVKGRLVGAKVARGSKVYLQELPSFEGGHFRGSRFHRGPSHVPEGAVDVGEDGAFRFEGVSLDSYMLMLLQPSPPRQGTPLRIEIEPFRVREQGIDRRFDLSADQPGVLRGRIELEAAQVPMDRLLVVARRHVDNQQVFLSPFSVQYQGQLSFVLPSGGFAIRVTPGEYLLDVVDLATGIRLHSSTEPIGVKAGAGEEVVVPIDVVKLSVKLTVEETGRTEDRSVIVDRVEVRSAPAGVKTPNARALMGGNESYDTGVGVTLEAGQTEFEVVVPPGEVLLLARSNAATLETEPAQGRNPAPLGRLEVTVEEDKPQDVELKVEPPEEIEANEDGSGQADADKG